MILTETEARAKICKINNGEKSPAGGRGNRRESYCVGSECMTYWRWIDEEHAKGYCSITGKPDTE